jgi:hypothetical protein
MEGKTRHLFPVVISIAMMYGVALGQTSSTSPQAILPSPLSLDGLSGEGQATSNQRPVGQRESETCNLRVLDTALQSPGNASGNTAANGSLAYTPLPAHCKFDLFLTTTYSPYTFLSAGFQATLAQAEGQWPQYGGGMQGGAKRFGASLADTESRRFIQTFALSTLLHQDPRYFPSRKRKLVSRAWYAATRVVVTRNDRGYSAFNTSELLGALFTSALQNSYYPRHDRNLADTTDRFTGALGSDAVGNIAREFTPDMKQFFRKHAPKKIRKIEEKLPIPAEDKP